MTQLKELGNRGIDHRDIIGAFDNSNSPSRSLFEIENVGYNSRPEFLILWNHDRNLEHELYVQTDKKTGLNKRRK